MGKKEAAKLLNDRYGVRVKVVAGCVVTREQMNYVEAYNWFAESRIRAHFRMNVIEECYKGARERWGRPMLLDD